MRATRAYLASLGTTGLLVLSSVLLLVLGSAFVTFNGWPSGSGSDEPESVLVETASTGRDAGGPAEVALVAAPAAEAVAAAAPAPPAQSSTVTVAGDRRDGGSSVPPDGVDVSPAPSPGPGAPDGPTDTGPPGDPDRPGEGIPLPGGENVPPADAGLVENLSDGVENTTTYLGQDVVGQLSPDLGLLLTQAGQGLTDLLRALDGTPPPPRR